jgi:outer membrane receptor protein involved in Fe transport
VGRVLALGIGFWLLGFTGIAAETKPYDIPSTDGATALQAFLEQSGADVVYANADLRQVRSNRLVGAYGTSAALERLFAGTALVIVRDERTGSFLIRRADEPRADAPAGAPPLSPMKKKDAVSLLGALALGSTSLGASGQTPREHPAGDEVIALAEFRVTNSPLNEYLATDSITGTRVASKLSELPFAVNAITSEFIDDFVLLELNDQLATVSGFSPNENENSYQLRGFASGTTLVDGFRWLGSAPASFASGTDRIEVIKGAVASIYGQINPGGVINTITRKPLTRREQGLSLLAGSMDTLRTSAYATGPAGASGKLFYRADVAYQQRRYVPQFADMAQRYGSLQFSYRRSSDTNFNVAFLLVDTRKHMLVQVPIQSISVQDPYRRAGQTFTFYTDLDYRLFDFSLQGPDAFQNARTQNARASIEHRINRVFSVRAGLNLVDTTREVNRQSGATLGVATQTLSLRPIWEQRDQTGVAAQIDTLAAFRTGGVNHKLLFTLDYNHETQRTLGWQMGNTNRDRLVRQSPLRVANPVYGFALYRNNPGAYDELTDDEDVGYSVYGAFLSERAALFDNRLIFMAGARYDKVFTDPKTLGVRAGRYAVSDVTYQSGVTFRVTGGISLYVNRSTSFSPQPNLDLVGKPLPNEQGSGHEFGLKLALANERLHVALNRFQVDRGKHRGVAGGSGNAHPGLCADDPRARQRLRGRGQLAGG